MAVRYSPGPVPGNPEELNQYIETELGRVSSLLNLLIDGYIEKVNAAPNKLREGMMRFADGTNWNPGAGQGVYVYRSGAWHLLG